MATAEHVTGMLAGVKDLSGEEILSYDARGRTAWKIKRIPDARHGQLSSYKSDFSYDAMDRVTRLGFPDGDHVGYGYNARNLPETVLGGPGGSMISAIDYAASGQMAACRYGNGVESVYQYDPRLRLRSLDTSKSATQLVSFIYSFDAVSNITRIDDVRSALPAADPRRNSQVFTYDNLYRLGSVQYPALSGGASISYAYDRIGNMLSQTSDIAAEENGLPVTNLGAMSYGGSMGASGRIGRDGGQPGPHALTGVTGGDRSYAYDANGNMESIDGMDCTWDFKDRLIAVENERMRAEYSYDYTDRRITKKVTPKPAEVNGHPSTVYYIDRSYEIREDGGPVKYVWSGETRVARVLTNLNATQRVQRFRLHDGWNICTLAVSLENAGARLAGGLVQAVYRYDPVNRNYHPVGSGETLAAGTQLRVQSLGDGELAVQGTPVAGASQEYPAGRHWIGNAGFQPLRIDLTLPAAAPLWYYDAPAQAWKKRLAGDLATIREVPASLEPGEGVFVVNQASFTITPADPTLEIRYYHQDHLGSSSVMSDGEGQLVSETAFYPFGHPRVEHAPRNVKEVYGFTQKERDGESGLNYFEARYYAEVTSAFLSVDSAFTLAVQSGTIRALLQDPGNLNGYAYARRNPIGNFDPDGRHTLGRHEFLTRQAINLGGSGFSPAAVNRIVKGNLDTDKFQGNSSEQTRMHGMIGSVKGRGGEVRLQTLQEAKTATQSFIDGQIKSAVNLAMAGNVGASLEELGKATHAAQDRLQHNFEPWTAKEGRNVYETMWNAFKEDPFGVVEHGIRDFFGDVGENLSNYSATMTVRDQFLRDLRSAGGDEKVDEVKNYSGP
jgi:RHS repeat-associated protein